MSTQNTVSDYEKQAQDFLAKHGLKFRATLSDSKPCEWHTSTEPHHFRITLYRDKNHFCPEGRGRLTFDFWSSIADAEKGILTVKPYDVLACISSDAYCPETFAEFCADYGYEEDSIKALQTFNRCSRFAKRLRAFFTPQELEDLSQIS